MPVGRDGKASPIWETISFSERKHTSGTKFSLTLSVFPKQPWAPWGQEWCIFFYLKDPTQCWAHCMLPIDVGQTDQLIHHMARYTHWPCLTAQVSESAQVPLSAYQFLKLVCFYNACLDQGSMNMEVVIHQAGSLVPKCKQLGYSCKTQAQFNLK